MHSLQKYCKILGRKLFIFARKVFPWKILQGLYFFSTTESAKWQNYDNYDRHVEVCNAPLKTLLKYQIFKKQILAKAKKAKCFQEFEESYAQMEAPFSNKQKTFVSQY